ncbi:hypothetical protein LWX53_00145 [bacterium]|nr:hypothetical protein [bacterium]
MRIREMAGIVDAEIIQGAFEDAELAGGYTSDLLSDVMAHAKAGEALITIQAHKNTVAVASLIGAPAIVVCNGRPVPEDMVEAARDEGIAIVRTDLSQYEVSGRLWKALRG